jgi:hypothetical protein
MYKHAYWVTMALGLVVFTTTGYFIEESRQKLQARIDQLERETRKQSELGEQCDMHLNTCLYWQARVSYDLRAMAKCQEEK